jgi:predicted MFS family arabinose efflux permease
MSRLYALFAGGVAAWALTTGLHQVLFAWLVVGVLRESPAWIGTAQMFLMLPSLLFLLVGGVAADRLDRRRLLIALHTAAAGAALALAIATATGHLSLRLVVIYALAWGTIWTFALPARDALLSEVAGANMLRAVTGVTLAQFAGQAIGTRLAGIAGWVGSGGALALLAAVTLASALPVALLPAAAHQPHTGPRAHPLAAIREGLREVWRSPILLPIALLVAADGLFFMGPYLVLCPLLVRDWYQGDVASLSLTMMVFTVGTMVGSGVVLWRGGVRRKGRAFLLALFTVATSLVALAFRPPFGGFLALLCTWGIGHSFFLNTSRTLFQEMAPASRRARVLSVHALGLLGMAPFSNLGAGLLAGLVGAPVACALAGGAMIVLTALAWVFTRVADLE